MTEYRIRPVRTFIADLYLQFKQEREVKSFWGKKSVEVTWHFIPEETPAEVFGNWLTKESCPTSLSYGHEGRFLNCFVKQDWDLRAFAKNYPDIEVYFEELREKRKKYLEEQDENKKTNTVYL